MKKQSSGKTSSWLTALFITMSVSMMTGCATPTQPAPDSTLLLECRDGITLAGTDGKAALEALTDWGAALRECRTLNAQKAAHIRNTSGFYD